MADARTLSRTALRRDQVLEINWTPWPDPPPELLKVPGFNSWWLQMKLVRERDVETFQKLINNLGIASSTPGQ